MSWVRAELESADLGDARRTQRFIWIVEDLAASPNASVPQASRDKAAMQGMYDFWANRRVDADAMIRAHAIRATVRMAGETIVRVIQDTTKLDDLAADAERARQMAVQIKPCCICASRPR